MGYKQCRLVFIARNNPEAYRKFLGNLRLGCSLASSCASIGISPKSGSKLLASVREGKGGKEAAKIAKDIKKAIGEVMGLTEAEVRKLDPRYWLKQGPGRILTNEWNDTADVSDVKAASNTISSKDITDALIQLYRCGISIDNLIESGQISSLQIGAASSSTPMLPAAPSSNPSHAASVYGESSYGIKETPQSTNMYNNGQKETNQSTNLYNNKETRQSNNYCIDTSKETNNSSNLYNIKETTSSPNIYNTISPSHSPSNPPPKLLVQMEGTSEELPGPPDIPGKKVRRSRKVPLVSDGDMGVSSGEIGNKLGASSQEKSGHSSPQPMGKSIGGVAFPYHTNYDGPIVKRVRFRKVEPTILPAPVEDEPDPPGKKGTSSGTHPDVMREQKKVKDEVMEEVVEEIVTLPDGLKRFLESKGTQL